MQNEKIEDTNFQPRIINEPLDECYVCKAVGKNWHTNSGRGTMSLCYIVVDNVEYTVCNGCLVSGKIVVKAVEKINSLIDKIDSTLESLDKMLYN